MSDDFVICPYCNKTMKQLTNSHLKLHNKTCENIKKEFQNIVFISNDSKNKRENTFINKFGCKNPMNNIEVINKSKNTCIRKYGCTNPFASKDVKEKIKNSNIKKYGVEFTAQVKEIKNRIKKTNIERYGTTCTLHNKTISKKAIETNRKKYGTDHPSQNKDIAKKTSATRRENNFIPIFTKILNERNIEFVDLEYIDAFYHHNWKCGNCNNIFNTRWQYIQRGYQCPKCYPRQNGDSIEEIKLREFIVSLGFTVEQNNRKLITPYELDIVIPDKNIAIEYNGIYWHSDKIMNENRNIDPKKYHLDKINNCANKNYKLITIFEDEWIEKQDIVKSKLSQILGINNSTNIDIEKCSIREITTKEKNAFLNKYHLEGTNNSTIKLGAFYNNQLISCMTFFGNIDKKIFELNRFCSDYNYFIPGIESKLLSYFKKNYKWKEIFSYADRRWLDESIYNKLGFENSGNTEPNYWYVKNGKRIHRFNLRKKKDEPKNITEAELRSAEGYYKIYDCGNIKYTLKNKKDKKKWNMKRKIW